MKTINRGTFKPVYNKDYKLIGLTPVDFNIEDRELWLRYIQLIDSHMVGSGNYSTDYLEKYNLIFQINAGKGQGKSYRASEDYYLVLQIEIYTWYRPEEKIRKEVLEGLRNFPIIFMTQVIDAFMQRDYYRNVELIKIDY